MAIRNVVQRGYGAGATIPFVVTRGYSLGAVAATAAIGGAISFTETEVSDGGQVTTITLANDTWVADGATFDAQRQNIINGLNSAQSEATGWNAEVRDKEVVTAIVRTSDTVVTITFTAAVSYDITAAETITVTVPGNALTGAIAVVGSPTISVSVITANLTHTLTFSSLIRSMAFDSATRSMEFSGVGRSIQIQGAERPRSFILLETGDKLLKEDGFGILKEQE